MRRHDPRKPRKSQAPSPQPWDGDVKTLARLYPIPWSEHPQNGRMVAANKHIVPWQVIAWVAKVVATDPGIRKAYEALHDVPKHLEGSIDDPNVWARLEAKVDGAE